MKAKLVLAAAIGALMLAACQPPATTPAAEEAPAATEETAAAPETTTPVSLPCGVLEQRNWTAEGAATTLTVAGEIDLGTPGYGVSLARDPSEAAGATTALLNLTLRAPTGMQAQVVTPHSVRYFGPAASQYTSVRVSCDGAELTTINVTR